MEIKYQNITFIQMLLRTYKHIQYVCWCQIGEITKLKSCYRYFVKLKEYSFIVGNKVYYN